MKTNIIRQLGITATLVGLLGGCTTTVQPKGDGIAQGALGGDDSSEGTTPFVLTIDGVGGVRWNDACVGATAHPIAGAYVRINEHRFQADTNGQISFNAVTGSSYQIVVEGYEGQTLLPGSDGAYSPKNTVTPSDTNGALTAYVLTGASCPVTSCTVDLTCATGLTGPAYSCQNWQCLPASCTTDLQCPGDMYCLAPGLLNGFDNLCQYKS